MSVAQALHQHLLVQSAVARHLPHLLSIMLPYVQDHTIHTALTNLAVGLEPFKAEGDSHKAMAAVPSIGAFIQSILPFLDDVLTEVPMDPREATKLPIICDLLTLAIKTFKSAVEVCMREAGDEQDICATLSRSDVTPAHSVNNYDVLMSAVHAAIAMHNHSNTLQRMKWAVYRLSLTLIQQPIGYLLESIRAFYAQCAMSAIPYTGLHVV